MRWLPCSSVTAPAGRKERAEYARSLPRSSIAAHVSVAERLHRSVDRRLDRSIGYYPLAIRLSLRHGFHRERMAPGHENWMLDSSRVGPLPRWDRLERRMAAWHYRPDAIRASRAPRAYASRLRRTRALERPAAGRRSVPRVGASPRHSDRRARRELGSHGRQGSDRALLRRLHRPERDDAGRPDPVSRDRARTDRGHGLAANRRLCAPASPRGLRRRPSGHSTSTRRSRSSPSWGTHRRTRPSRIASSSESFGGGRRRVADA